MFFDASRLRISRQSIQNSLAHVAQIPRPWDEQGQEITGDKIRIMLKIAYFSNNVIGISVSSTLDSEKIKHCNDRDTLRSLGVVTRMPQLES